MQCFPLQSTFVVERQPLRVLRTNSRFAAKVRLLVGGSHISAPPAAVSVSILNEAQAKLVLANPLSDATKCSSGDISNGSGTMQLHAASQQFSASFR